VTTKHESPVLSASYFFEISVTEPQKVGDALSAHVVYKIKTFVSFIMRVSSFL